MSAIGIALILAFAGVSMSLEEKDITPIHLQQLIRGDASIWNNIIPTRCERCQKAVDVLTFLLRDPKTFNVLLAIARLQCDVIILPTLRQKCKDTAQKLLRDLQEKVSDSRKVCEDLNICDKAPPTPTPPGDSADANQFFPISFAELEKLLNNASSETESMLYDPITCQACKTVASHLANQLRNSLFQKTVVDVLTVACKLAPIPNKDCGESFAAVLHAGLNAIADYFGDGNVCKILVWC